MPALPSVGPGDLVGGKYAITRVIGSGGMAVVYEAQHVKLGQPVAMKMLLPELLEREDIVARFEREARAAARLRSPHVARVFDVDALPDGTPYLVMELLEGRDLAAELALRGPLSMDQAIDYVLQVCDAMAEAHRQGTVHRDLKPSNLFLTQSRGRDFVKVLDFGVSKIASEEAVDPNVTRTRSALGTVLYMSPEQVRSAKNVDARTDVWSLGIVLYELLTARAPFLGESATAVAAAVVADTPQPLRAIRGDLPLELEQVIMKALEKDREKRFHDAAAFAAALAPFQKKPSATADAPNAHNAEREGPDPDIEAPATLHSPGSDDAAQVNMGGSARVIADSGQEVTDLAPLVEPAQSFPPSARAVSPSSVHPPRSGSLGDVRIRGFSAAFYRGAAVAAAGTAFLALGILLTARMTRHGMTQGSMGASGPTAIGSAAVLVGTLAVEPPMDAGSSVAVDELAPSSRPSAKGISAPSPRPPTKASRSTPAPAPSPLAPAPSPEPPRSSKPAPKAPAKSRSIGLPDNPG
jgi:serine/threonine-protein kinase